MPKLHQTNQLVRNNIHVVSHRAACRTLATLVAIREACLSQLAHSVFWKMVRGGHGGGSGCRSEWMDISGRWDQRPTAFHMDLRKSREQSPNTYGARSRKPGVAWPHRGAYWLSSMRLPSPRGCVWTVVRWSARRAYQHWGRRSEVARPVRPRWRPSCP